MELFINKKIFFYFSLTYIYVTVAAENSDEYIQCANSIGSIPHIAEDGATEIIPTESFQICKNKNDYCYTLWQEDPINGTTDIKSQGKFRYLHFCLFKKIIFKFLLKKRNNEFS